jgi:2-polyprenyl-3-methyl-5-hydroxy-6-metoxy-1,4-benzoquinol methylase
MNSAPQFPESTEKFAKEKTGEDFWDTWWLSRPLPPPIDPYRSGLKNYPFRKFHEYFERVFAGYPTRGKKLIEIGCAQSVFLPYLAKYFGFDVSGLDRSELGCERARAILNREGVTGAVYRGDLFSPPPCLFQDFDVAISFGVVEHFEDTGKALGAIAKFLKREGRTMTSIPNLSGMLGSLQKFFDRSIYDVHVPLDKEALAAAHGQAGLEILACEYFLPVSLDVLNIDRWPKGLAYKITLHSFALLSRAVWLLSDYLPLLRPNRWSSPYIICVAQKL